MILKITKAAASQKNKKFYHSELQTQASSLAHQLGPCDKFSLIHFINLKQVKGTQPYNPLIAF